MAATDIDSLLLRQRSVASIPSKFETVLHDGGKERDAFWTRTHRFTYQDDELPGPGAYALSVRPEGVAPSFSKRGYTGMASKTSRFASMKRGKMPAPGAYDPDTGFKRVTEKRDYNVAGAMSMFHKPIVAPEYVKRSRVEADVPGPGHYYAEAQPPRSYGVDVPFNTRAERWTSHKIGGGREGEEEGETEGSVYDYEAINRVTGAFSKVWTSNLKGAHSVFKSRTGRVFDHWKDEGRDKSIEALKPHPSLGPSLGIQVEIAPHSPSKDRLGQPGPGYYDPFMSEQLVSLDKLRHSSMFSRTALDRFGHPLVHKAVHTLTPGPGAYQVHPTAAAEEAKPAATSAVFASATARNLSLDPAAGTRLAVPGPAYYNPSLPGRKSFNLNAARRWV